jgi:hypothetical protein
MRNKINNNKKKNKQTNKQTKTKTKKANQSKKHPQNITKTYCNFGTVLKSK